MRKGKHYQNQKVTKRDDHSCQHKQKIHSKKSNLLINLILLIGIILVIYSSINIYKWYQDSTKIKENTADINKDVVINEVEENGVKLLDVDFSKIKETNPDTVGWIQVPGTNVNYPFVQTNNNDYYLTHSFDKSYNNAGWIFLDYRNDINTLDKNNIFYAHGRLDGTMFGSLKNVLENSWFENTNNHIIKISTENQNTSWQIFSVYLIPATSDYLQINFNSDNEFKEFANMVQNRSKYKFDTTVENSDKIITLSTCYNNNSSERLVIHAKLNNK